MKKLKWWTVQTSTFNNKIIRGTQSSLCGEEATEPWLNEHLKEIWSDRKQQLITTTYDDVCDQDRRRRGTTEYAINTSNCSGHQNRTKLNWLLLHQLSLNLGLLIGTLTTPNNTRDPITNRHQQCGQSIIINSSTQSSLSQIIVATNRSNEATAGESN